MAIQQDQDIARMRQQVQELVDRHDLINLLNRQGLWLDEKRYDEAGTIFTEDAIASTPGGTAQGIAKLIAQARRNHDAFERTQHVTTNVLIELDGDRATLQANLIVTCVHRADTPSSFLRLGERYGFEAVRTLAGWRFSRVEVTPVWKSGS